MFTGIITHLGKVKHCRFANDNLVIELVASFQDVVLGESIAVNGACLTVEKINADSFQFFLSSETLEKTNLKTLAVGELVNLERALKLVDRLSGHYVQGHVDMVASLVSLKTHGEAYELQLEIPAAYQALVVEKGSITIDGISLTINKIMSTQNGQKLCLSFMVIPHTWKNTNLSLKKLGSSFNIEFDVIAKYVEKNVSPYVTKYAK